MAVNRSGSARLFYCTAIGAGAATRTRLWCGIPDSDGQRAAESVDAHDGGVRMTGGQGSEWCRRPRGAVQSLGHVRRTFQEELLRRQERGTAGAAAGAGSEPRPLALGGGQRRHTWLLLGTPYRASAKSAALFSSTS